MQRLCGGILTQTLSIMSCFYERPEARRSSAHRPWTRFSDTFRTTLLYRSYNRRSLDVHSPFLSSAAIARLPTEELSLSSMCDHLIRFLEHPLKILRDAASVCVSSWFVQSSLLIDIVRQTTLSKIRKLFSDRAGCAGSQNWPTLQILGTPKLLLVKRTCEQRIQRLAQKNALCYLSSVIRLPLCPGIVAIRDQTTAVKEHSLEDLLSRCAGERRSPA